MYLRIYYLTHGLLMNFTIKQKLIFIVSLVSFGFIALYFLSVSNQNKIETINEVQFTLKNLQINMLQLRRNEKDFMLRKDKKYLQSFESNAKEAQNSMINLKSLLEHLDMQLEDRSRNITKIGNQLNLYKQHFETLVKLYSDRGLNETEGNYGLLRQATHQLEEQIASTNDLGSQVLLLTVRRNEKDFMLRVDNKYVSKLHGNVELLSEKLSESKSIALLKEYLLQFNHFVEATSKIGFDSKSGKQGEMRNTVREMEALLKKESVWLENHANEYISSTQTTYLSIVIATSTLIGLIILFFAKQIITPLQMFSKQISEIRRNNDLSKRIEERGDEIGAISKEFNSFMSHFQLLIKNINQTVESLSESTNVVSRSVSKTSEGLQDQASQSDMIATAITEMGATATEIANNAHATKEKSDEAYTKAGQGKEKLDNTVLCINQLSDELIIAGKDMLNLEAKSNGITSVLEVIKSIAEQTNLLALNAAIEAARAGDQGRGFAVVADEVRTLAIRTQDSTSEITTIINELQTTTSEIVKTINQCKNQGLSSASQAQETELVLNEIILNVEDISDMTMQVATAVEEQSAVVQDVGHNIIRIRYIGEQVASDSQENAKASQDVANLSKELHKEANVFTV